MGITRNNKASLTQIASFPLQACLALNGDLYHDEEDYSLFGQSEKNHDPMQHVSI